MFSQAPAGGWRSPPWPPSPCDGPPRAPAKGPAAPRPAVSRPGDASLVLQLDVAGDGALPRADRPQSQGLGLPLPRGQSHRRRASGKSAYRSINPRVSSRLWKPTDRCSSRVWRSSSGSRKPTPIPPCCRSGADERAVGCEPWLTSSPATSIRAEQPSGSPSPGGAAGHPVGGAEQKAWAQRWIMTASPRSNRWGPGTAPASRSGNQPTLADCFLIPQVWNSSRFEGEPGSFLPPCRRWAARAADHPAFVAAHPSGNRTHG